MQDHDSVKLQLDILLGGIPGIYREKMSGLSETIHNDPNRVIALRRAGKSHNEIHGNLLPFPNRDRQGLQKS